MPNPSRPFYPQGHTNLITTDPQIVKAPGAAAETFIFEWGARPSLLKHLQGDPTQRGGPPGQPSAPEMVIKHTGG